MKIIDMRCRPAFLHDFFGATPGTAAYDAARWLNRRVGSLHDEHFLPSLTQEGFLQEVDRAGVDKAVVVGRHTPQQHLPNDQIHQIVHDHQQLLGIGAVDPVIQGTLAAVAEAERAIKTLGLSGIDLEPGFGTPPRHPDDRAYFPIYEVCAQLGVPVFLMSGPTTPNLEYNDPAPLARVAQAFPHLPIVCYHGFYPNVHQAIGVAFRYENVFLVPDMYQFVPGSQAYVEAANGFMADQLLFGSSYPFRPITQSVQDLLKLGLKDQVVEKVLYSNARELFKLTA
jgi:predicted TIM-barrel fold metal-dependent hydrolase